MIEEVKRGQGNLQSTINNHKSSILGAAFLMATSAIGPGFLTQTAVFTEQYLASFGFIILLTILIDLAVQLNVWTIIGVSGLRGQDVSNRLLPGLGFLVAGLVALGGLAFNIGNVAGAGLGLQATFGIDPWWGATLSALAGIAIFAVREIGAAVDAFAKALGVLMILLVLYVAVITAPPLGEVAIRTFLPARFGFLPVLTLVGGTVGGYITFAGGHRLVDAGVTGPGRLPDIRRSAISGILIASLMRALLFLAFLGVVTKGVALDPSNPPASAFGAAAGSVGYRVFGMVLWSAAITSVVGSAYTSISFLRTLSGLIGEHERLSIAVFILTSAAIFLIVGRPVQLLILAGSLNGLILPITLATVLAAASKRAIVGSYQHPKWLLYSGYVVVLVALLAGYQSLKGIVEIWK
ncbi:MAG: divalent metal cation transporter [Acidobacteria bacterium]|nr:MAG: divalent metal cation transporter [Acidobacteriota bacterium]